MPAHADGESLAAHRVGIHAVGESCTCSPMWPVRPV